MATLLDAVNQILKRLKLIQGDSGEMASLTDEARQNYIDVAVQVVNEGIEELYSLTSQPKPKELATATVVLAEGTRSYPLAADLVQLHFPLIDQTHGDYVYRHPDGYMGILREDPEQDDTGLPIFAVISPEDGTLYFDRSPTAESAGRTFTYWYDKDLSLSGAADTLPFNDAVFRAMVPAWAELWKRNERGEFDSAMFRAHFARAARLLNQVQARDTWSPR